MKRYLASLVACVIAALAISETGTGETPQSITVPTRIDRVMVYHDRALVARRGEVRLKEAGVYDLVFRDLPR
ncbi:MAG: hypothetical protein EHM32_13260 [Spirochaetales bacterium]|nr:MAG: hypothetical protein EHM32_13260 [Spirochaetales bacterium]